MLLLSLFLFTSSLIFVLNPSHLLVKADDSSHPNKDIEPEQGDEQDFERLGLHYGKYLKEVVAELDKDQKFTENIKNMSAEDIKSGKVAEQLKHVHEDIRKKLSDLKYLEIKRLRDLATRKNEIEQYGETYHGNDKRKWRTLGESLSEVPGHLASHRSFFDVDDLHKLMLAATNDLEKLDQKRKAEFKVYEMEKEHQFQERIKTMNETERAEAIKLRDELQKKHDDHPKVNEPGKREQFMEVWEKQDHLPGNEFEPKTFFSIHDTNNDNYWDWQEVKQILVNEINKLYDTNNPEDDPNEMEEEFERMREHVYQIIDSDKDGLISLQEFLEYSKKPEFNQSKGWESPTKNSYSKEDYEYFTKHREEKLKENRGFYDPSLYANQPANLHLPNWGYAGVPPYYGIPVDPNHPQANQILAAQQHQQMAYQQAAYQQQAQAPYIQAPVHPQQAYQQPPQQHQPNQQYYQAPPVPQIAQNQPQQQQQQYQQRPPVQQQMNYQQPAPQLNQQQQPQVNNYQQVPPAQQAPQAVPQQAYQQPPQPSLQPAPQQQQQQQQQAQPPQQQPPVQQQQPPNQAPPSNQQYYQQPPPQQPNHQ